MKDQSKTEIKVGLMVIVGALVFLWVIGWAKNFSFSTNEKLLDIKFSTVAGLEIGDPVTVNGVRKGNVVEFKIESEDVIVEIKLDPDINLKEDASFAISMLDLMGGKKINISPGNSKQQIDYDKVQQGQFQPDIPSVMATLGSMQGDLDKIVKEVQITLTSLNSYLTDQQFNDNIKSSLSNLKDISSRLDVLIAENQSDLKTITSNTVQITSDAKYVLQNNKESIQNSLTNLQSILVSSDSLLFKLNNLADETTNRKNNLGKLLYDEDLYNNLTTTLREVKEMTKMINEQLKGDGLKVDANIDLF